jgi:hypothetical protein
MPPIPFVNAESIDVLGAVRAQITRRIGQRQVRYYRHGDSMAATSSNPSSRTAAPVRGTANHARSGGLWLVMYITRTIASSSSRRRTYAPIGARPRVIRNSARARSIAARFRRRLSNQARAQSIIREATQRRFHWHIDSPTCLLSSVSLLELSLTFVSTIKPNSRKDTITLDDIFDPGR